MCKEVIETEKTECSITFIARLAQDPIKQVQVELFPEEIEEIYWKTVPAFSIKKTLRRALIRIANAMK